MFCEINSIKHDFNGYLVARHKKTQKKKYQIQENRNGKEEHLRYPTLNNPQSQPFVQKDGHALIVLPNDGNHTVKQE